MITNKSIVLTVGGFDPSSGAGITADLKVINEIGAYGVSAITAITTQNSKMVYATFTPSPKNLRSQIEGLLKDMHPVSMKIGMLSNKANILVLKNQLLKTNKKKIILDPILRSTSGMRLLDKDGEQALVDNILPLSLIVTPNLREAERLSGITIKSNEDIFRAASIINDLGPKWVIIKGGHIDAENDRVLDYIYDGADMITIENKRINKKVRGTGCILSSAIAAYIAKGQDELEAIKNAREFVQERIENSVQIGGGNPQV